ncbi:MAG: NAD(P)-binding domain-containing protein [Clostridia bacterium]|nr:NAD(P)-binding domain-containing protein [Clostridia bacterium]
MSIVTIIGSGMMGSALAFPAMHNGHEVRLVGTPLDREIIETARRTNRHPKFERDFPEGIKLYQIEEVEEAINGSTFIICGVSSFGVEWFADNILPIIPDEIPVLSVTKGLMNDEDGNLDTYPDVWQKKLDSLGKKNELNAIGGPCTSYELVFGDQTLVAFCGKNIETLKMMKQIMATDYYHIITTTDVIGIEAAVALKNGYALGITLTIGEVNKKTGKKDEFHYNSQAGIFLEASREMRKLIKLLGGNEDSYFVGVGDLYVTVYGGRTRQVGILLGEGKTIDEALDILKGVTLESLVVAKRVAAAIRARADKGELDVEDFPLLMHVDEIITQKKPVSIPWEKFTIIR